MSEYIRSIDIKMDVDTNKRTVVRHAQPESIGEAVALLRRMADELEEEMNDSAGDLHTLSCMNSLVHGPHTWVKIGEHHHSRYFCEGR